MVQGKIPHHPRPKLSLEARCKVQRPRILNDQSTGVDYRETPHVPTLKPHLEWWR